MIDNLTDATRLLKATQLMLLGKDNQPISDLYYALQMALDLIEESKWVSVKERLPDKNGKCLVSLDFGDVCLDSYDKDWGFVCYVGNVTHWRPLPKAPESEENK